MIFEKGETEIGSGSLVTERVGTRLAVSNIAWWGAQKTRKHRHQWERVYISKLKDKDVGGATLSTYQHPYPGNSFNMV